VLRHHAARGAPDDLARPVRGRRDRRRQPDPALLAHHDPRHQTRPHHRHDVLDHLHVLGLPARLRAHARRPGERDASLRDVRVRHRHVGGRARDGRRCRARDAARARVAHRGAHALPQARVVVGGKGLGGRIVRLYVPLAFFLVAMLFPFYWMAITSIKPNRQLFIPMADIINRLDLSNTLSAVMLTYPTLLIPFCAWLLMGYFKSVPRELEEAARIDGASRFQAMMRVVMPLCTPGLLSAGIFAFTLAQNEFLYALIFLTKSEVRTVPVGAITELVRGDV